MMRGGIVYQMLLAASERMKAATRQPYAYETRDAWLEGQGCKFTRMAHGISLADLSRKTDLPEEVISRYEDGDGQLTEAGWKSLGNALSDCIRERAFALFWETPGSSSVN